MVTLDGPRPLLYSETLHSIEQIESVTSRSRPSIGWHHQGFEQFLHVRDRVGLDYLAPTRFVKLSILWGSHEGTLSGGTLGDEVSPRLFDGREIPILH